MRYLALCGLICFGWYGSFQVIQADPIVPLTYTLTPFDVPGSASTNALGINNSGQIVGSYTDSAGAQHGFLDTNGTFTTLPFVATGINNVGQIVGLSNNGIILDTNGAITNIALPGFGSFPSYLPDSLAKINDLGQITGSYNDPQRGAQAFIYSNGTFTFAPVSYPEDEGIAAHGINNAGQVLITITGFASFNDYIYQNGQYTPVFNSPSTTFVQGAALNNVGQIVGTNPPGVYVDTNGVIGSFGFYLPDMSRGGVPLDINDAGVIVGGNLIATPVPEPASLVLFAGGLIGLWAIMGRKRNRGALS